MNKFNEINEKVGKYRWTICALLFVATTMNYTDRQVLALLKNVLEVEFNWTDTDYANITATFQFTYAFSMLFAGRFIDWLGTKWGYTIALIWWTIAGIGHGFATGKFSFMLLRGALGIGEAGGFPAAIKATAEYFPKKERALATGIFNSGTNVGAIITPLIVPWIVANWGWQWAFFLIAGTNLPWLIFWFWLYDIPSKQKRLSKKEYEYILSDNEPDVIIQQPSVPTAEQPTTSQVKWYKEWGKLLTYKQTWSFAIGKFMTDGVWWFFLFWLPAYLKAIYGMTGKDIMIPIAVLYSMTCVGSVGGGAFPMYFIRKGYEPYAGRMRAMIVIAFFPLVVLLAQPLGSISYWMPVLLIGIGASAHQAWSANIFTTVSDMFPKKAVASVTGIGGMAGGVGGIIINKVGGWLFDAYRASGIADFWEKVKGTDLAGLAETVSNSEVMNRHGQIINLNIKELGDLPREAMMQLLANTSLTAEQINQLIAFQKPIVQSHMSTSYAIMFSFCAVAYLIAWMIMKSLVPKHKPITDL